MVYSLGHGDAGNLTVIPPIGNTTVLAAPVLLARNPREVTHRFSPPAARSRTPPAPRAAGGPQAAPVRCRQATVDRLSRFSALATIR